MIRYSSVYRSIILLLTMGILLPPLFSQSYLIHKYSEVEGMPSNDVFDIAQDMNGRMWFASRKGLIVYDGLRWEREQVSESHPDTFFYRITITPNDSIYAMTIIFGKIVIYRKRPGQLWKKLEFSSELEFHFKEVSFMGVVDDGASPVILIGTLGSGVYLLKEGHWRYLSEEQGIKGSFVKGMCRYDRSWMVATEKGVFALSIPESGPVSASPFLSLENEKIIGICSEHSGISEANASHPGVLWIHGNKWIAQVRQGKLLRIKAKIPFTPQKITHFFYMRADHTGGLFWGDRSNIFYYHPNEVKVLTLRKINGMIDNGCNSIFMDKERTIWFSSQRGISKVSSRLFSNYHMIHGLLEDEVTAILEPEPGKFIFGHNYGLSILSGDRFEKIILDEGTDYKKYFTRVMDMCTGENGSVLMACSNLGLLRLTGKQIIRFGPDEDKFSTVLCVRRYRGHIYVGTNNGVFRFVNGSHPRYLRAESLGFRDLYVRRLYAAPNGLLYAATANHGLLIKSGDSWARIVADGHKLLNSLFSILQISDGTLLLGSAKGLFHLDKGTIVKFERNGFSIDRPVYFILEDRKKRLWFGTNNGVICRGQTHTRKYNTVDGLSGEETNRSAAWEDSFGKIWFGTNAGLSRYNDEYNLARNNLAGPKVHLLYIDVNGKKKSLDGGEIRLTHAENDIIFHFRGISFLNEKEIRFQSQLEGFEKNWSLEHYPFGQFIRYSNVPPGSYRFNIKAKNTLGKWGPVSQSPSIIIAKPYYRQIWFILFVFLFLLFLIVLIVRYIYTQKYSAFLKGQVTERTVQLKASESRFMELFQVSKDVIFITRANGEFLDINDAGPALLGYSFTELVGMNFRDLFADPAAGADFTKTIEENGDVKDYEAIMTSEDKSEINVLISASVRLNEENEMIGIHGIMRDITEKKKLEAQFFQSQKMESVGRLAGGIAHDFNNLLTIIQGFAFMIEDQTSESNSKSYAAQILKSSAKAEDLIRQILAFSRKQIINPVVVDVNRIMRDFQQMILPIIGENIGLTFELDGDLKPIFIDSAQFNQVIMNLVVNARDAISGPGTIIIKTLNVHLDELFVSRFHGSHPGENVLITVSDNGKGIPPEDINKIFEPFFSTKGSKKGTGLGLSTVYGIVKQNLGYISVESEVGIGTTFFIYFPAHQKVAASKPVHKGPDSQIDLSKLRVLAVEDEPDVLKLAESYLKSDVAEVFSAPSGEEAIRIVREKKGNIDLIFTDLVMPGISGKEMAEWVLAHYPKIRILFTSGHPKDKIDKYDLSAMDSTILMKPYLKRDLIRKIAEILGTQKKG